jgi:hypothetical protein
MSSITFKDFLSKQIECPYLDYNNESHLCSVEKYIKHIKSCEYKNDSTKLYKKALQIIIDLLIDNNYSDSDIFYIYNKCLIK